MAIIAYEEKTAWNRQTGPIKIFLILKEGGGGQCDVIERGGGGGGGRNYCDGL